MEIKKTLILDINDPLSKALTGVLDSGIAVIVTRGGRYYGIIDDRNLKLFHIQNPSKVKCERAVVKPPVLYTDTGILERTDAFLLGHFKALPVVNKKEKPVGITTRVELLQDMLKNNLMLKVGVKELMNSPVYTIDYKKTVGEAKLKMKRYKARRLIVTRMGKPVGTFSTLDLTVEALKPKQKQKMPIVISTRTGYDDRILDDLYRPDLTTIPVDSMVEDAAKKMIKKQVSSVVVMSEKKPLGVLSALDIFKAIKEIAEEKMQVGISGLDEETIVYRDFIREDIQKVAERFEDTYGIRRVNVHIKKGKSVYTVNIMVEGEREKFNTRTEGPSIRDTVNMAAAELRKCLAREKRVKKSRKVLKKGGLL
jgi:predicted transcriptional regulator